MACSLKDDSKVCAICWDEFATPKNLKCGHTFCLSCLKSYQKKSENRDEIKCPLCRQKQKVFFGCLDKLPDNYFVKLKPPEPDEKLCCSLCPERTPLKPCSHCDLKLCPSCKFSHKLALTLSNDEYEVSSDSGSDEDEDKDLSDDGLLPFHVAISGQFIKTKFNATLQSSFSIKPMSSYPGDEQNIFVSNMHENETGLCEIITCYGPECVRVDIEGTELDRRFYDQGISCIIGIGMEQKIIAHFHERMLLKEEDGDVQLFTKTENLNPTAVCQINNGQIVCVGWCRDQPGKSKSKETNNNDEMGALHFYDRRGHFLKKITRFSSESYMRKPRAMSYCKSNDTICVSDTANKCVYIVDPEGELLTRYTGVSLGISGTFLDRFSVFVPGPVSHNEGGDIFVGNRADHVIHILSPIGQFLGYLASRCDVGFGSPFALMFDSEHRLWVGDSKDGKIRVFEITSYKNFI